MMIPEEVKFLTRKTIVSYPLAGVSFLEPYLDKALVQHYPVSPDAVFTSFDDCLTQLHEKDLSLGFRKTYLEKETEKNILTMLQMRDYISAEVQCEDIIRAADPVLPTVESLKGHIEKHIFEEAWVDIQKNLNEWHNLSALSSNSERRDLQLESAYFTQNLEAVEQYFRNSIDEEQHPNFQYYTSLILFQGKYSLMKKISGTTRRIQPCANHSRTLLHSTSSASGTICPRCTLKDTSTWSPGPTSGQSLRKAMTCLLTSRGGQLSRGFSRIS